MYSCSIKPVDGLVATSTSSPVNITCELERNDILALSGITANNPSKLPVESLVKLSLATPAGKSLVETDVTGYL